MRRLCLHCIGGFRAECQTGNVTQATDNQVRVAILTCSIAIWLPIAVAITGLSVTVYGVAQQSLRLMADEQAAALALRTAARLNSGVSPSEAEPTSQVDIATSLDPFVLVFNADRQLLSATATLRSQPPDYPTGVFDTLRTRAQDRVTWQPEAGIRDATVAVPWNGGFVVGGGFAKPDGRHHRSYRLASHRGLGRDPGPGRRGRTAGRDTQSPPAQPCGGGASRSAPAPALMRVTVGYPDPHGAWQERNQTRTSSTSASATLPSMSEG